jgi:hypothetical protein
MIYLDRYRPTSVSKIQTTLIAGISIIVSLVLNMLTNNELISFVFIIILGNMWLIVQVYISYVCINENRIKIVKLFMKKK